MVDRYIIWLKCIATLLVCILVLQLCLLISLWTLNNGLAIHLRAELREQNDKVVTAIESLRK